MPPTALCRLILAWTLGTTLLHAEPLISFNGYSNTGYRHRDNLAAWENTAALIRSTVDPQGTVQLGRSPADLSLFFKQIALNAQTSVLPLVFLSGHQSPYGEWDFPNREVQSLQEAFQAMDHSSQRILILDACFAAAAERIPGLSQKFPVRLYSCASNEETHEIDFNKRRPLDVRKRYSEAYPFIRTRLGNGWNGRVSFLGLCWAEAMRKETQPPNSREAWLAHFQRCVQESEKFRETTKSRLSSTLIFRTD